MNRVLRTHYFPQIGGGGFRGPSLGTLFRIGAG